MRNLPSAGARCGLIERSRDEERADPLVTWTCWSHYRYGSLRLGCCLERKHMAGRLVEVPAGYSLSRLDQKLLGKEGEEGRGSEK